MKNNIKLRPLVDGAIMIALAAVLCYVRVFKLPWGGSITLLSMLPIMLYSIKYGVRKGLLVSFVFSLIQLMQGVMDGLFGWGLSPVMLISCILIDYIGAYTVIGTAGIFRSKGLKGKIGGIALAGLLRFLFHFLSGIVIWHSFGELWSGFATDNEVLYSLLYNGAYMLPEIVFTIIGGIILLKVPSTEKLLTSGE